MNFIFVFTCGILISISVNGFKMVQIISRVQSFQSLKSFPLKMTSDHSDSKQIKRRINGLMFGLSLPFVLNFPETKEDAMIASPIVFQQNKAYADSTGKMSTKLTARKRYLPRVVAGVSEFKKLAKDLSTSTIDTFVKDVSPGFVRAMDLYGVSLRKGETPDEVSREAEKLSKDFGTTLNKLSGSKDSASQYKICYDALEKYLSFAKLSSVDSADY